jgi:leucyl aminopeptidase
MEEMKYDMCGAGTVLGLMRALSILKPPGCA